MMIINLIKRIGLKVIEFKWLEAIELANENAQIVKNWLNKGN